MTAHRIEITFAGDAPDSELERAKILGSKEVGEAIADLQSLLASLGLDARATAHSVRKMSGKPRAARVKLQEVVEPTTQAAAE